ncbi:dnaJ homolog dnj-5 [Trichoplusia ni]|uniref:DnaJ homolog dnj-5 n=1 Tax=Trichoplusia ni TaxID=7111 RepID=A0A7E5WG96_TRINI|nr:dnaJ homolog dnj-5 [Trichoplusia ni]
MARSPKDDPIYNDMKHNTWNYHAETAENCAPGSLNERKQPQISSNSNVLNDNSIYVNPNFVGNDVYLNKHAFNVQSGDTAANKDEKIPFNNMPNVPRTNQNYGNAMLKLSNGQLVRVFYDENNQQLIFPMSGQYELFNHNQGVRDIPMQMPQPSHLFTLNQDFSMNNNNVHIPTSNMNQTVYPDNAEDQSPTSNFLKDLLGNLEPNSTGTYSPFGQNYPLNHPDASNMNILTSNPVIEPPKIQTVKTDSPKRNENSPLADTSNKKRIVAEVKPMRPTYSDVLAKNTKNTPQTDATRKVRPQNIETKPMNNKINTKPEKPTNIKHDDNKHKSEKKHTNTISSGSESGDINTDDTEKRSKPNKKSKNKRSNISRKWSSLDDITNEEDASYTHDNESQFVFIENPEKPLKKEKKADKLKSFDKSAATEDEFKLYEEDDQSEFVLQEGQSDNAKAKKKKDGRSYHKAAKPVQDKKKTQSKFRRNKPGYLGLAQNYLEHWGGATWKALVWFMYLLSDICRMSFHLSFDLCTSVFTQTYVSSQAVWRSSKDWLSKFGDNKYFLYIDRKFGHTRVGFWRKLKWFKKAEVEPDNGNDSTKLNANIPLPATGEEAMKRLLACKGKDPYSILGVSVTCTDEEIKRYYRRQAFLVHPDKNQQPGAEEAFKILQHAFDLIGEPERREAYERRALESRHVEAAWSELSTLLAQLHDKMEFAANTIRCTNCGRRHKRVLTERPCYAARYCVQCKIRHSAKEGDIWAESSMMGLLVMYYACMDGAVYQITQWASCQKKNLRQLRPDCHVVQYRIVLGNKANATPDIHQRPNSHIHDPNLEEFLTSLYNKTSMPPNTASPKQSPAETTEAKKRRNKKPKA